MFADNNLFNPAWTTGSLSAIAPVVTVVGAVAVAFISIGGFFMVILPIMKNVVDGIVVVAPNWCNRIDEAHRTKLGLQSSEGGNQITAAVGSLTMIFFSFFPNFLAISSFSDGVKDPKSFMIRAIPKMCIYVFIGVFIFEGYPARVADKFSQAATGLIDVALNNVDPTAWIEKIPTNLARPDLSTSGSTDTFGKNVNKLSKSVYSALTSKYSAMSKDARINMSHQVESFVEGKLAEIDSFSKSSKYKLTVETRVTEYSPSLNKDAVWPKYAEDSANHIFVLQFATPITGVFDIGTPGGTDGAFVSCTLKFYELAAESDVASNVTHTLVIPDSSTYWKNSNGNTTLIIPDGKNFSLKDGGTVTIGTHSGSVKRIEENGAVKYEVTFKGVDIKDKKTALVGDCTGIYVYDATGSGSSHQSTKVEIGGSSFVCKPNDSAEWEQFAPGQTPVAKGADKTTETNKTTS